MVRLSFENARPTSVSVLPLPARPRNEELLADRQIDERPQAVGLVDVGETISDKVIERVDVGRELFHDTDYTMCGIHAANAIPP